MKGLIWKGQMAETAGNIKWAKYLDAVTSCQPINLEGKIVKVSGLSAEGHGPGLSVGSLCVVKDPEGLNIPAEVIGFKEKRVIIMPFGEMRGIKPGSRIVDVSSSPTAQTGDAYLGRIIDGLGQPLDGKGMIEKDREYPIYGEVIKALAEDDNIDMLLVVSIPNRISSQSILDAVKNIDKPLVVALMALPEIAPSEYKFLSENGVPTYSDAKRATFALAKLCNYVEFRASR